MSISTKSIQDSLLNELIKHRTDAGFTQADLAERMGSSRMTVARAEAPGADLKLSSFVAMAAALGFRPSLTPIPSPLSAVSKTQEAEEWSPRVPVSKHIHRGYAHNRTKTDLQWRDRQRERALAKAWEALNSDAGGWLTPVFENLVPKYTPEQAQAAATVVQWMGSEVGFQFLTDTLKKAGYEIVDKAPAP